MPPVNFIEIESEPKFERRLTAIAEALSKVSPQECENYLANQGYRRQL